MSRVLVVDDEKLIVKGIKFSLEQDGMDVDCAYDGEEALAMAQKIEYDVVLLDIMLPKMDGFEVCYLTDEEKIKLCEIVTEAKADYIKTSTGFGTGGATMEDILLFKKHIGPDVKMKAAGGIRTKEDMEGYLNAGCDRIGTSGASNL